MDLVSTLSYMLIDQTWSIGRNYSKIRTSIISIMPSTLLIQNSAYRDYWTQKTWIQPGQTRSPLSPMLRLTITHSPGWKTK